MSRPALSSVLSGVALLLPVLIAVAPFQAAGATLCLPREAMVENLRESHAERPVSMGLDNSGVMIEVFAAPAGNWTILMTQPNGMSCLMAAGQGWETLPLSTAGIGS